MSPESAGLAKKMGYSNIRVMLQGVPGWKKAGQQVVASDQHVNNGNLILVDLRPEAEAAKAHIKGAVNIPFDELEDARADFPLKAPVVVYGGEQAEVAAAVKMIKSWGLKTVSLVDGGLEGYVARGNSLAAGEMPIEVSWVRKLGKGEVAVDEFLQVSKGLIADKMILDVRTAEETAAGKYANALCIPLDNLEKQLSTLPPAKEFLVHCSTGARAEMAFDLLKKKGIKSRFLVADLQCTGIDNCTVD